MQSTVSRYQMVKNKRRLVQQNIKLQFQITNIQEQIDKFYEQSHQDGTLVQSQQVKPLMDQIASQQKTIRKLKWQIEKYHLERAKDNVEYIVREEDELKMMKKQQMRLLDEKQIYLNKKQDKSYYLDKEAPYQQYEKDFLEKLTEVVHHNREQAAKIIQIERQIRKYHLLKKSKDSPHENTVSLQEILGIEKQIAEKKQAKRHLEEQWKPHFEQFDVQFARLLHQASKKKEEVMQLERQDKIWETRVSAIRDAQAVFNDKNRRGNVKVSSKLRQKILDFIDKEEQKKKKKVNEEDLKYQFIDNSRKQAEVGDGANKDSPPPLPGQKKKDQKVIQLLHNDKNITKKLDKAPNTKKNVKVSQNSNTEVSIPPNYKKKGSQVKGEQVLKKRKSLRLEQDVPAQVRKWEESEEPEAAVVRQSPKSTPKNAGPMNGVIKMQEMGMETVVKNWEDS